MFPAISTPDEAQGLVSYLTKDERVLLLTQLHKFREETDVSGMIQRVLYFLCVVHELDLEVKFFSVKLTKKTPYRPNISSRVSNPIFRHILSEYLRDMTGPRSY